MKEIECFGKDGIRRIFKYKFDYDHQEKSWHFRVYTVDDSSVDFFESTVKLIDDNTVQQISIEVNDQQHYGAKGIPESLLPEISNVLDKKLISSPSQHPDTSIRRNESATKMWWRLCKKKIAEYDIERDIFNILRDNL